MSALDWLTEGDVAEQDDAQIVRRSDLERYAGANACPFAARAIETGKVIETTRPMAAGQEVHRIIGLAVLARIKGAGVQDLVDEMVDAATIARPDVQAEVVDALKPYAARRIAECICIRPDGYDRNPDDILGFDGGDAVGRSGVLAWDTTDPAGNPIRMANECDLLCAGVNKWELDLYDFKSGWMSWSSAEVGASFQFGTFYSHSIFRNFPEIARVNVLVVMPKLNDIAFVSIDRDRVFDAQAGRITQALQARSRAVGAETPECWPIADKCATCPALSLCPAASGKIATDVEDDPARAVREWAAMHAATAGKLKGIKSYAKDHGPIDLGDGKTFPGRSDSWSVSSVK